MIHDRRFQYMLFFFSVVLIDFHDGGPIWMIDTFMHINTDAQRDNLDMQY